MKRKIFFLLLLAATLVPVVRAQCPARNTAFQSGETLIYDLYFNWKFVWVKAGTASMNTTQTTWQGHPCYKTYLITRGSEHADKYFVMRDTLTAFTGLDLTPIYYVKAALENKTYRKNEVWYSYADDKSYIRMRYQRDSEPAVTKKMRSSECAFDMISMLLRARSFDPSTYRVGHRINFLMADGHDCERQAIVYHGRKKFKMEHTGVTYRCLVFSFMEKEKGKNKEKEVVRFYITDDKNHLPVRLDLNLNFGTAKAFLTGVKGLRNPQDARLR